MNNKFLSIIILFTSIYSNGGQIIAAPIEISGPVGMGGSGCSPGSAVALVGADRASIKIFIDAIELVAGGKNKSTVYKSCAIAIPVHVSSGHSVAILPLKYEGLVELPKKAKLQITEESFFAGSTGTRFKKVIKGPVDSEFAITNQLNQKSLKWSNCGEDTIIRTNFNLLLSNTDKKKAAVAIVASEGNYRLLWKRCGAQSL